MHGALTVERDSLALQHVAVVTVPASPPHVRWLPTRVELYADIDVIGVAHHGAPVLAFGWIRQIPWITVRNRVFKCDGLAEIQGASQQDFREEHVVTDLLNVAVQFLATLPDLDSQHVRIAEERDPVDAMRDRLDDVQEPSTIDPAVLTNVDVVVQRKCLMSRPPDHFVNLTLSLRRYSVRTRHDAYAGRPSP